MKVKYCGVKRRKRGLGLLLRVFKGSMCSFAISIMYCIALTSLSWLLRHEGKSISGRSSRYGLKVLRYGRVAIHPLTDPLGGVEQGQRDITKGVKGAAKRYYLYTKHWR